MKKIIDRVVNLPNGCETSKFPASFASVWMRVEGLVSEEQGSSTCANQRPNGDCCGGCDGSRLSRCHRNAHNLYAVVSGISFVQIDLSNDAHLTPWWGPGANRILAAFDDYIRFTMDFAGYTWERFDQQSAKQTVFDAIKRSLNADRPVLINFGPYFDWYPVIGYDDETGRLYGYDGSQGYWDKYPAAEGYEDGMFYLSGWHEAMSEAVVITGRTTPGVTYNDVFRRMIRILQAMSEKGDYKRSAEYLRTGANFAGWDEAKYRDLARRIDGFIGQPIDQRPVTAWCFESLARMAQLEDKWQFFKRIIALFDNTHDICWIAWRMVGAFGAAPVDECVKALQSPIVRRAIAEIIDIVRGNDVLALDCLREMMA